MSHISFRNTPPNITTISEPAEQRNLSRNLRLPLPIVLELYELIRFLESELHHCPALVPVTNLCFKHVNAQGRVRSRRQRWNSFITAATRVSGSPLPTDLSLNWFISNIAQDLCASTLVRPPPTTIDIKIGAAVAVLTMLLATDIPLGGTVSGLMTSQNTLALSALPLTVLLKAVTVLQHPHMQLPGRYRVTHPLLTLTLMRIGRALRSANPTVQNAPLFRLRNPHS